jgi:hypothetical protein
MVIYQKARDVNRGGLKTFFAWIKRNLRKASWYTVLLLIKDRAFVPFKAKDDIAVCI